MYLRKIIVFLFFMHSLQGQDIEEVQIGDQIWMSKNLSVTTFNDGTQIPQVTDNNWHTLTTPAWCWYENDSSWWNDSHGKLYNYYAIESGKLCPIGWRMPTIHDYRKLVMYLDPSADTSLYCPSEIAGGMLKSDRQSHWGGLNDNIGATNESGLGLLFGGCRSYMSNFTYINGFGYYGCIPNGGSVAVRWSTPRVFIRDQISKYVGVSVRCIRSNNEIDNIEPSVPTNLRIDRL